MKEIILNTASLFRAGEIYKGDGDIVVLKDGKLNIILPAGISFVEFEKKLYSAIRERSMLASIFSKLDSFSVILFSLAISVFLALLLGLLSLYEDLMKSLFLTGGLDTNIELAWFAICVAIFILIATFVPSLFSGEGSRMREWIDQWYMRTHRVRRRLRRSIKWLSRGADSIVVWNPCVFAADSWVWDCLIPSFEGIDTALNLNVRHEYQRRTVTRINDVLPAVRMKFRHFDHSSQCWLEREGLGGILPLLESSERLILDLLVYLSTANLPAEWTDRMNSSGITLSSSVSLELTELITSQYRTYLMPGADDTIVSLSAMLRCCIGDYRMMNEEHIKNYRLLSLMPALLDPAELERVKDRFPYMQSRIVDDLMYFTDRVRDPIAILILMGLATKAGFSLQAISPLSDRYIANTRTTEMYFMVKLLWSIIDEQSREEFYHSLSLQSMKSLVVLSERAGMFQEALDLARFLQPLNWFKYRIAEGRMLERLGKFQESAEIFFDDQRFQDMLNDQGIKVELLLSCCLQMSWIVVSGRLEDYREKGRMAMTDAAQFFESMSEGISDPNLLWHYHNNLANYAEWDNDIESAIREYQHCLKIPGVELKWISGTYVNLGIAGRMMFVNNNDNHDILKGAVINGFKGARLKQDMGDNDELPVALHNAALNVIEAFIAGCADAYPQYIQPALDMCNQGLALLSQTGSMKKKGMLLAEWSILARIVSGTSDVIIQESRQALELWLSNAHDNDDEKRTVTSLILRADKQFSRQDICSSE
ncbi:MAG: hypothetical protein ISR96_09295 [Nitrospira sp.]|nr:hypothetical protein [bacterium]MBL7049695.1 hypothetical protein [Nitrospira sp.]